MKHLITSLAICATLFAVGCQRGNEGEKVIAFVAPAPTGTWALAEQGCIKADQELDDARVEFRVTGDGTTVEQRRQVDDLMVRGVDGLILTPLDPKNQAPMIDELAARIPVMITDSDIPDSKRICYVGTNNVDAGREAGKLIKEVLPEGGKIVMFVGKSDAQNAKERIQGIKEAIEGSGIEVVDIRTDDTDRVRAKANASDILVKYPDIDCLVGLWNYNAPTILKAVEEADKLGKVKIVAFDEEEDTLTGVINGHIHATVVQQPFEFGYQAVKLMNQYLNGDKSVIPENGLIDIPITVIRKDTAADFLKKLKELKK